MMKPSAKPLNAASGNKGTKFLVPELPKVPKTKNAVQSGGNFCSEERRVKSEESDDDSKTGPVT